MNKLRLFLATPFIALALIIGLSFVITLTLAYVIAGNGNIKHNKAGKWRG